MLQTRCKSLYIPENKSYVKILVDSNNTSGTIMIQDMVIGSSSVGQSTNKQAYKTLQDMDMPDYFQLSVSNSKVQLKQGIDFEFFPDRNTIEFNKPLPDYGFEVSVQIVNGAPVSCYVLWAVYEQFLTIRDSFTGIMDIPQDWLWKYPGAVEAAWSIKQNGANERDVKQLLMSIGGQSFSAVGGKSNLSNNPGSGEEGHEQDQTAPTTAHSYVTVTGAEDTDFNGIYIQTGILYSERPVYKLPQSYDPDSGYVNYLALGVIAGNTWQIARSRDGDIEQILADWQIAYYQEDGAWRSWDEEYYGQPPSSVIWTIIQSDSKSSSSKSSDSEQSQSYILQFPAIYTQKTGFPNFLGGLHVLTDVGVLYAPYEQLTSENGVLPLQTSKTGGLSTAYRELCLQRAADMTIPYAQVQGTVNPAQFIFQKVWGPSAVIIVTPASNQVDMKLAINFIAQNVQLGTIVLAYSCDEGYPLLYPNKAIQEQLMVYYNSSVNNGTWYKERYGDLVE